MLNGQKEKSEAQRGKPKGTLESEIRIAMLLLEQHPPLAREGNDVTGTCALLNESFCVCVCVCVWFCVQ